MHVNTKHPGLLISCVSGENSRSRAFFPGGRIEDPEGAEMAADSRGLSANRNLVGNS